MSKPLLIGDFLHRIRRPIDLDPTSRYKLVTVKLYHKGVVLREEKLGADIKSKMYQVKKGDFILSGIDARNGAFGIVPPQLDGAVVTNDFWYFKIDDEVVDKNFFLELTATRWFDEICRKGSDGTTQRIRLQKGKFFNQTIYLPDLAEQRIFNRRFQAIKASNKALSSELTHQQTLLKKLRQQILQEAIEGKLTADWRVQHPDVEPASELLRRIAVEKAALVKAKKIRAQKPLPPISDEEKPFELPDGWEWCRTGMLLNNFSTGPFGSMLHKSDYVSNGIPLVNPANIVNERIVPSGKMMIDEKTRQRLSRYILEAGDLVIARRGDLSKCTIVSSRESGWLCGTGSFFLQISEYIYGDYFVKVYRSSFFQRLIVDCSVGQTMNNLNQKILNNALIPLPPLKEQQIIVTKVEKLLTFCDQLEAQITQNQSHAEQLMQAVLKEAFRHNSAGTSMASEPQQAAHA